jgi:hypothetical protein
MVEPVSPSEKMISRALGEEMRRAREARGLSRGQLVALLPSGIGDRTLLSYEHGTRHLTAIRLIEIGHAVAVDGPTLMARGLQRARIHAENMTLTVDLHALLRDVSPTFRPLHQWARNMLNDNPSGTVKVEMEVVRNLAMFIGCHHLELANHLCRFIPGG